jgi:hypothetical protein
MSDCCTTSGETTQPPAKHRCPVNGKTYTTVPLTSIFHHINAPWNWRMKQQSYYFCEDPDCEVVYFGRDDSVIERSALRTPVGIKEKSDDSLVCYCFGVSVHEARTNPLAKAFVIEQTKSRVCACEAHNPSGRCCLKDFPEV